MNVGLASLPAAGQGALGRGGVLSINTFPSGIGFAFFAFVVSCFGSFGPTVHTAVSCIFSLADLEMRQHESLLASQGLPPMDPSARSQFRAICYRQTSARICHAVAKASVMRLL